MSRNIISVLIYHHHKSLELISEHNNFHKIVWTLPDDGSVEPKHVAIKSSDE
jgi:hypothetical protein